MMGMASKSALESVSDMAAKLIAIVLMMNLCNLAEWVTRIRLRSAPIRPSRETDYRDFIS